MWKIPDKETQRRDENSSPKFENDQRYADRNAGKFDGKISLKDWETRS